MVGDGKAKMLRGVPRSVKGADLNFANLKGISVGQEVKIGQVESPLVLPVLATFAGEVERGLGMNGKLTDSGEEVGVDVSIGCRDNSEIVFCRDSEVALNVALGINDDGLARSLTADEVGVLREGGIGDLAKEHHSIKKQRERFRCAFLAESSAQLEL
jgi:hypothetical protein